VKVKKQTIENDRQNRTPPANLGDFQRVAALIAKNGTFEVRAANRFQASPKAFSRFRSIEKGPPTAKIRKLPKKTTEARSPLSVK